MLESLERELGYYILIQNNQIVNLQPVTIREIMNEFKDVPFVRLGEALDSLSNKGKIKLMDVNGKKCKIEHTVSVSWI